MSGLGMENSGGRGSCRPVQRPPLSATAFGERQKQAHPLIQPPLPTCLTIQINDINEFWVWVRVLLRAISSAKRLAPMNNWHTRQPRFSAGAVARRARNFGSAAKPCDQRRSGNVRRSEDA